MAPRTLADHWLVVYRRRWIVLLAVVSAAATAYVASGKLTPIYRSTVEFFIQTNANASPLIRGGAGAAALQPILQREELRLYKGMLEGGLMAAEVKATVPDVDLDRLPGQTSVTTTSTNLLRVRVLNRDPQLAAQIANAFPAVLGGFLSRTRDTRSNDRIASLGKLAKDTEAELALAQGRLSEFLSQVQNPDASATIKERHEALRLDVQFRQDMLHKFTEEYVQARSQRSADADQVVVVSAATADDKPVFPIPPLAAILAALLGLVGGVYLAFLFDYVTRLREARVFP